MALPGHRAACEACRILKQDIPEVEAVIAALVPRLERWWVRAIERALRRGDLLLGLEEVTAARLPELDALSRATPDGRSREEVEQELIAVLQREIRDEVTALPAALAEEVEEARDSLLLDAALALGLSLDSEALVRAEARLGPLRAAAEADLRTLLVGRLDTRQGQIRTAIERLVTSRRATAAAPAAPAAAQVAQTFREELRQLLGAASPRQWLPFVADQWSYRWFNIGQFLAARDQGHTLFQVFNNPPGGPDRKTTPFCRRIHGRTLLAADIEGQIREHVRAALAGSIQRMMQNWPLLPGELVSDEGPGGQARSDLAFRQVGLPPYHGRCRTVVRPLRLDQARV